MAFGFLVGYRCPNQKAFSFFFSDLPSDMSLSMAFSLMFNLSQTIQSRGFPPSSYAAALIKNKMGFRPIFYIKKYKPVSTSPDDDMASDVYLS